MIFDCSAFLHTSLYVDHMSSTAWRPFFSEHCGLFITGPESSLLSGTPSVVSCSVSCSLNSAAGQWRTSWIAASYKSGNPGTLWPQTRMFLISSCWFGESLGVINCFRPKLFLAAIQGHGLLYACIPYAVRYAVMISSIH